MKTKNQIHTAPDNEDSNPPTPPGFPVPLVKHGEFSFLRDIVGGKTESEQRKRFCDFLRYDIPRMNLLKCGVLPSREASEAEVNAALASYEEKGFAPVVYELVAQNYFGWNAARLAKIRSDRASKGGKAKQEKKEAEAAKNKPKRKFQKL